MQRWVDANEKTVESISGWALYQRCPQEFKDALRDHVDISRDVDVGQSYEKGGTCGICGKEYDGELPTHLQNCEGDI